MPISRRAARVLALAGAAAAVILCNGGPASAAVCSTPNVYPGDDTARSSIAI
jgi:hypothetical protein